MEFGNESISLRVDKGVGLHRIKGMTFIIVVERQSFSCTHSIVVVGSIVTCSSRLSDLEQAAERESRTLPLLASTHVSRRTMFCCGDHEKGIKTRSKYTQNPTKTQLTLLVWLRLEPDIHSTLHIMTS
ncbi:hypothetical protein OIU74_026289 [Salix koriyanagi]|uniref:Uncharacterized protein n=1 Tax=Salix koriyanagi TaxID=2511006 RepID=A0A9Q0VYD6_9ROSI|nr:hypothetical protein OIU74_026289 [Salix koriyanagi]